MEKLTIEQLKLYIGCEYRVHLPTEHQARDWGTEELGGKIISVDINKKSIILDSGIEMFLEHEIGEEHYIKGLILRPLSDITDDEKKWIQDHGYSELYLIEKQFDIFGWIEDGLAIDRTKLVYDKTRRKTDYSHHLRS